MAEWGRWSWRRHRCGRAALPHHRPDLPSRHGARRRTPLLLMHRFDPRSACARSSADAGSFSIGPLTAYIAMLECPSSASATSPPWTRSRAAGRRCSPRWSSAGGATGAYIHNAYGLTETAAPSHMVPSGEEAPVDAASGALSIGVPIPDTESKVVSLEGDGEEVADGEVGQILTRGAAVFPGYWPARGERERAARRLACDRRRRQARRRRVVLPGRPGQGHDRRLGYKIWPRDVEDVLFRHPAVQEAAVVGVPDSYRGETVLAYVVLRQGAAGPSAAELIEHCRAEMAVYKSRARSASSTRCRRRPRARRCVATCGRTRCKTPRRERRRASLRPDR